MVISLILLNEKIYAEECLKNKIVTEKPFFTLTILAKYYYHCFGYRKKKITELLTDFMDKHYPKYDCNKARWNDSIEKIAKSAGKYSLFEIDGVWITKSELEIISDIHNKVLERLAFTLLCIAKLNNIKNPKNNGWVNTDAKEVFSLARVYCRAGERYCKLNALRHLSLLEFSKKNDNLSVRVTFINNNSKDELFVSDFRELGYKYQKYCGENIISCRECGALFKRKHKNEYYCKNCKSSDASIKYIQCVDCGKIFDVNSKNNKTQRCFKCQTAYEKLLKSERNKIYYDKIKTVTN